MFSYKTDSQSGNIVIYILIAIALFGILTAVLTRLNEQSGNLSISEEQQALYANNLTAFSASAQNIIDQMVVSGSSLSDINFINPASAGFDTAPHYHKLYHPAGGGLNMPASAPALFTGTAAMPPAGWYIGRFNNVEWTPSSAPDIIVTAYQIDKAVCEAVNRRITGNTDIPALAGTGDIRTYLIDTDYHGEGNAPLTALICAGCENMPSLCVSNGTGTSWAFYSIIGVQ